MPSIGFKQLLFVKVTEAQELITYTDMELD